MGIERDQLATRVAITIGIFAFLFTFIPIINGIKPLTDVPTIADGLVTLILIATIVFTKSSIVGYILQSKWIDRGIFLLVAGIIVYYLGSVYPLEVTWWLVHIIIIGIGYGLIFLNRKTVNTKQNGTTTIAK